MSEASVTSSDRYVDDSRNADDAIDLRGIIITLRKHKWPIVLVTALATALAAAIVSSITPQYRATASLLFENNRAQTGFETPWAEIDNLATAMQTQVEVLKSRTLASQVVKDLRLQDHWEYNKSLPMPDSYKRNGPFTGIKSLIQSVLPSPSQNVALIEPRESAASVDAMARRLMSRTTVIALKNTNIVRVSVDGMDRELATELANGIGQTYTQLFLEQTAGKNTAAKQFLEGKVADLKLKLEESEQQLLRERRNLGLSGDGNDISGQTITLFNSRLVDAKTRFEEARIQWDEVRQAEGGVSRSVTFSEEGNGSGLSTAEFEYVGSAYEVLPVVDTNSLVQRQKQLVQEAQKQLEELDNRYGDKHPRVIDARSDLQANLRNLDRQIGNVVASVEKQYLAAQRQVQSIENDIRREESKQFDRNEGRVAIKEIELTRDSNKRFYEDALTELRAYQEKDLQTVPMSVSDLAAIPTRPFSPKKTLVILLSFLVSLFSISALFFVLESMRETVQGVADVEKKLGIPVFGIVPVIRSGLFGKRSTPLVPGDFKDKRGSFEEAIRTIRTSATVAELDKNNQVIMVTSAVPGEGKSTVASNLAYSLSKLENTVLVEADMRRPGLGRALGLRSHGLSNVLSGETYLEDALRSDAIGKLDVIPAGRIPENHLELLASPEFVEVIELLRSRYDRIVIDMAPVQAVSDAIVVGKYVDSTIYVVKADGTPIPVVKRGVERLNEKGVGVNGIVISQVDLAKISSYGGDYYYQGYYDYYGYGEDLGKPEGQSISQDPDRFRDEESGHRRPTRHRVSQLKDRRQKQDPKIVEDFRA